MAMTTAQLLACLVLAFIIIGLVLMFGDFS